MTRLEAIKHIRNGGFLTRRYLGRETIYGKLHTYSLEVSKKHTILRDISLRENVIYPFKAKDVLAFIKKHYSR